MNLSHAGSAKAPTINACSARRSAIMACRMHAASRQLPFAIFLLLAGLYLLTTGGHTYASDEEQLFRVAEALVTRGSFALEDGPGAGPHYSVYGPGQSILATPFYALGRACASLFPPAGAAYVTRAIVSWFNPFVTAATGALVALAALQLGYGRRAAAATALLYGLATMAWPYSKTFFAEPLAAALSFGAFVTLGVAPRRRAAFALAGLLAVLACTVKIQAGASLPFLGLWALWQAAGAGTIKLDLRRTLVNGAAWGLGAAGGLGLLALYQWACFGNPLQSGYGDARTVFTGSLSTGLYGLLFSPGRGLVWYAPPLLLLPLGLGLLWRHHRAVALLCGALTGATLLFYGMTIFWHGSGAWGPRFLNMGLPFMALPLVALLEARRRWPFIRIALGLTLLLAVPVQLGGVLINLNAYLGVQRDEERRNFELAQSPLVGHVRLLAEQVNTTYALWLAPGTLALADGFSYSEGDRTTGAQWPRWSLPTARVVLRPPLGARAGVRVDLAVSGCLPAPLAPARLTLSLNGAALGATTPCPSRHYGLLLAPGNATLTLAAPGWLPAAVGIDREGMLGVFISDLAAQTGATPLHLTGRLVPIPPAPAGPVALRQWTSDYRYGHWDLWPWYLAHAGLPAGSSWMLALLWAGLGLALGSGGMLSLRAALREADA